MISLYAACLRRLGLTAEAAGAVHAKYGKAVRPDTIRSWSSGRNEPPLGAFEDLRRFAADHKTAAGEGPLTPADALFLAEQVSPGGADDRGMPTADSMLVAIAGRLLS